MALRKFLILRRPLRGHLEGRTAPIQWVVDSFTAALPLRPVENAAGGG
jgi:hypothetical protein